MVIVTGATGHIGNVLGRELLLRGHTVRALVLPKDNLRPLTGLNVEMVNGDVTDRASLEIAFKGASAIFHLAGIITIMPGMKSILEKVNIQGAQNVAAACRSTKVRRLIYTSSMDS